MDEHLHLISLSSSFISHMAGNNSHEVGLFESHIVGT